MGARQWVINWLEAGRTKNEPDRQTDAYPFPFGWFSGWGKGQPVQKRTPANLRSLSESPIPRRAINVIKDGISKLEWTVTAINEHDQEKWKEICNVVSNVMRKPNQSDSFRLWLEQIVEDILVASAGASEIAKAGDTQRPLRLFPTDAFSIELYPNWDGKRDSLRYAQRRPQGGYVHLTDAELLYIRMNPRTNTPFGLSPLETVWESANSFTSAHKSAGKQAGNAFIRKILNLGKSADSNAVKAYRAYWENEVQGRGVMPIIGGGEGSNVLDLGATDDKALFIEWQRFLIEIVAIAFGVSPKKLGQTKDVNRNTADSEDEDTQSTIQSIADTIAEHINNEIIDGQFKMGSVIQFKFKYAVSLKDQKIQAEINDTYIKNGTYTVDEVRDTLGKKPHQNKLGEVILFPSNVKVIDINKSLDEQIQQAPPTDPNVNNPIDEGGNPKVKARWMKASDNDSTDTDEAEKEFIAVYLLLMMTVLRRGNNVSSVSSLSFVWTPTAHDIQSLSESLSKLKGDSWLQSYNRRRQEMGADKLDDIPSGAMNDIRSLSDKRATQIMGTYAEEMKNQLNDAEMRHAGLVGTEKDKAIMKDMEEWLTKRMAYKSAQISNYEAGESWNQGLLAHDKKYAPDTEYYVLPVATDHEACAEIIDGAPYTADTLPTDLPLHPNCPHRYYAVV